jgi:hypothetical protein
VEPGDDERVVGAGPPEIACPPALDTAGLTDQSSLQKSSGVEIVRIKLREAGKSPGSNPIEPGYGS